LSRKTKYISIPFENVQDLRNTMTENCLNMDYLNIALMLIHIHITVNSENVLNRFGKIVI